MKNIRVCAFVCFGILAVWQLAALSQAGNAPLRVVDMGKYNLGVGIIQRARLAAQSGAPWVNAFILYPWGDPRKTAGDGGEPNPKRLQKYVRVRP